MIWFSEWTVKILVTKPQIAWFGMNWQSCNKMIFFGISDSYERYYQAIRRCWRYWQKNPVDIYIVIWERETSTLDNVLEKAKKHEEMFDQMSKNSLIYFNNIYQKMTWNTDHIINGNWYKILQWDCVQRIREIESDSIDFSVFSPPFSDLFTYSDSELDMGNCKNDEEFYNHFQFLVSELYRVIKPWRLVSFHCMNLPTRKAVQWFIGLKDFRGDLIRMFQDKWFIYHSEVTIWKDPVVAMQRTKSLWLLHKTIKKDSSMSRQWIPDYVVTMRKPWDNLEPITHNSENFPVDYWQKIASPVWMDINQSDTLQYRSARDHKDEKHICPLQLDVIRRLVYLWSNPWDTVLSPFMWIGSEWFVSLELGRKFVWIELKKSYFEQASRNLANVNKQPYLFV
jgi:DNA modification methylase